MGKQKDILEFEWGMVIGAKKIGTSILETMITVGCLRAVIMNEQQEWSEKGQMSK